MAFCLNCTFVETNFCLVFYFALHFRSNAFLSEFSLFLSLTPFLIVLFNCLTRESLLTVECVDSDTSRARGSRVQSILFLSLIWASFLFSLILSQRFSVLDDCLFSPMNFPSFALCFSLFLTSGFLICQKEASRTTEELRKNSFCFSRICL